MQNDWIIDVLADLNAFAQCNGLPALATQLEEAAVVASVELASQHGGLSVGHTRSTAEPYIPDAGRGIGA